MVLTDYEKEMMNGKFGAGVAEALRFQVALGDAFNAERMVEISRAHLALMHLASDRWYIAKLLEGGARCRVPATNNPIYDLDYLESVGIHDPAGEAQVLQELNESFKKLGIILTYSCTPELQANVPRFGETVAFSESSATPYVNAVCGARTNRESAKSALAAAVTGRVPLYGYLLDENRKGDILVEVDAAIRDDLDYHLIGYAAAKKIGTGVPVFTGIPLNTTPEQLLNFGTELATGAPIAMYHIPGITPEAPDLKTAFGGESPKRKVKIVDDDLRKTQEALSREEGEICFVMLGCPHYSIDQVGEVANLLDGKQIHAEVEFWVLTSSLTKELAGRMGHLEIINKAGGHIIAGTCPDISCWHSRYRGKTGVTDSVKATYYTHLGGMGFILKRRHECVEIALKGGF